MRTENWREAPPILSVGEVFGGYRVSSLMHRGGMSALYEVEEADGREASAKPLVLKMPRNEFGTHPAVLVAFEVEQMVLSRLAGPHVPRLMAQAAPGEPPYLVMERVVGMSIAEFCARAPLDVAEAVAVVTALADAVHDLHSQHVVHFDLKPENVLLRKDGTAVLVDFGLARHAALPDLVDEEFHLPAGTAAYISPEQLLGVRDDPRSDVFAIGVIAYELVTGRQPFGAGPSRRALRSRLHALPIPPRHFNPDVPPWLQEVILRCLEARPRDRYVSAALLAHDLAHPEQIPLGERSRRSHPAGMFEGLRRWFSYLRKGLALEALPASFGAFQSGQGTHVLVAVDAGAIDPDLSESLHCALRRLLAGDSALRLTLVSILPEQVGDELDTSELEHAGHGHALLELRHWLAPLDIAPEHVRFHVEHRNDAAGAIIDYAARYHADLVLIGARGHSALRRHIGSVSARVAAEASCSVWVARPRRRSALEEHIDPDKRGG